MNYRRLLAILVFCLISPLSASGNTPNGYQYLFPAPNARFVHPTSTIILRFENIAPGQLTNLSSMITVIGEKTGAHAGKTTIASDNRTVIFTPDNPYAPGETVDVRIRPRFHGNAARAVRDVAYRFHVLTESFATVPPPPVGEAPPSAAEISPPAGTSTHTQSQKTTTPTAQPRILPNGVSVPADFPHLTITQSTAPSDEYIFLTSREKPTYAIVFEPSGDPVWYLKTPDSRRDFNMHPNGLSSMLIRDGFGGSGDGYIVMDDSFNFLKAVRTTNGYTTDEHELFMLPDSGYLLIGRRETRVDMSQYVTGGNTNARVRETCIQEFTADDQMIFIWRAWDHFDIRDMELESLTASFIRFPHMNALFLDEDDHILLSSRHLSEISKIDRQSGEFIWRMTGIPGSPNNDFQFVDDPLNGFRNQHAIQSLGNSHYTLFDNGNMHSPPVSRAVEYKIDVDQKTATLVWEYRNDVANQFSWYMGNAQRLPNGNTHINWAVGDVLPIVQEVTPAGEKVFEAFFETGSHCYRSFRYPWSGAVTRPYLMLEPQPDHLILLFNKFGDDNVAYYNIYADTTPAPTTLLDTSRTTLKRLDNLENGLRYYFRATAVNKDGEESEPSNEEQLVVNTIQPGTNVILNPEFSNGLDSWQWELQGAGAGEVRIENGVCHFVIQNSGTRIFDVQLRQNGIPLFQGQKYTFEFDAWAEVPRIVEIKVGQDGPPFTNYSRIGLTALSTIPKRVRYSFEMQDPSDTNARVVINAGQYTHDIFVDNFSLVQESQTTSAEAAPKPTRFALLANYPNPFNPATNITYRLAQQSTVSIIIYDIHGQEVDVLQNDSMPAGLHSLRYDASALASGLYFCRLTATSRSGSQRFAETIKMMLLR